MFLPISCSLTELPECDDAEERRLVAIGVSWDSCRSMGPNLSGEASRSLSAMSLSCAFIMAGRPASEPGRGKIGVQGRIEKESETTIISSGVESINEMKCSSTGQKDQQKWSHKRSREAALPAILDCLVGLLGFAITKSSSSFADQYSSSKSIESSAPCPFVCVLAFFCCRGALFLGVGRVVQAAYRCLVYLGYLSSRATTYVKLAQALPFSNPDAAQTPCKP